MKSLKLLPAIALLLAYSAPGTAHAVTRPAGKTLSVAAAKNLKITEIVVTRRNDAVPDEIIHQLKDHLTRKIDKCATGNRPVKLVIRLDHYKGTSLRSTVSSGGYVQFSGLITFFDRDGTRLAEYYNDKIRLTGGGWLGAAFLTSGALNFPQQFVQSMCETIFAVELPDDPKP